MKQTREVVKEIKLVGLATTTSYEAELTHQTSNIATLVARYHSEGVAGMIPHRKRPGVVVSAYTDYESDYRGSYTFFIGEQVSQFDTLPHGLTPCIVPEGVYVKYTTDPGAMPDVVIQAWQKIWHTSDQDLGGARAYHTDFQILDERARDQHKAIVDIYVGIIPRLAT